MGGETGETGAAEAGGRTVWRSLGWRQRATLASHLFKAVAYQHHREQIPLLRRYIPDEAVVIDVGAHAGQFTKIFSHLARRGRVFAFEPGSYARLVLTTAVRLRRLANVTIVPGGLGERSGSATLSVPLKSSGSVGFGLSHFGADDHSRPVISETVRLTTLDDFAAHARLARLDFLKADIEGWELHMLRGAARVLARHRPALLLEVADSHLRRAGDSSAALWRFLTALGYRARPVIDGTAGPVASRLDSDGDYLFLPERL
jgi:FkbM family methyltransferase